MEAHSRFTLVVKCKWKVRSKCNRTAASSVPAGRYREPTWRTLEIKDAIALSGHLIITKKWKKSVLHDDLNIWKNKTQTPYKKRLLSYTNTDTSREVGDSKFLEIFLFKIHALQNSSARLALWKLVRPICHGRQYHCVGC